MTSSAATVAGRACWRSAPAPMSSPIVAADHPRVTEAVAELPARGVAVVTLPRRSRRRFAGHFGIDSRKAGAAPRWVIRHLAARARRRRSAWSAATASSITNWPRSASAPISASMRRSSACSNPSPISRIPALAYEGTLGAGEAQSRSRRHLSLRGGGMAAHGSGAARGGVRATSSPSAMSSFPRRAPRLSTACSTPSIATPVEALAERAVEAMAAIVRRQACRAGRRRAAALRPHGGREPLGRAGAARGRPCCRVSRRRRCRGPSSPG